ncbi:MAG TPA: type 2 isopentenyl-diphosphate Delta-isomerase [Clostridia bacterium]|jgi:isopentenyl-diphosphate delta-isomerase|nr:type 2 isopentenyl-diphosphate Delta-isomerase [Clostridia bacterium]
MNTRQSRKLEHINYALSLADQPADSGLQDVTFVNNSLPEVNLADLELRVSLWGAECSVPLYINAMTGGVVEVEVINGRLAEIARIFNIPMAVGSQTAGLEDVNVVNSYRIVRKYNPNGIIWGNVGADVSVYQAQKAVEMIEANALQIHLNVPQELVMAEGDREFKGRLKNIEQICRFINIPIIVKEVGFGISRSVAAQLFECGVAAIDVGGKGGTNFVSIEHLRHPSPLGEILLNWGIGTVASLIEVKQTALKLGQDRVKIFASGGIRNGLDFVKLISLGADMVGIAKPLLEAVVSDEGCEKGVELLKTLIEQIKACMVLVGTNSFEGLRSVPLVISGQTKNWLEMRGYDLTEYGMRDLL